MLHYITYLISEGIYYDNNDLAKQYELVIVKQIEN